MNLAVVSFLVYKKGWRKEGNCEGTVADGSNDLIGECLMIGVTTLECYRWYACDETLGGQSAKALKFQSSRVLKLQSSKDPKLYSSKVPKL